MTTLDQPPTTQTELITAAPYTVQVLRGDTDISHTAGVATIRYAADGSATQTRLDGTQYEGTWRFADDGRYLVMDMPSGTSVWEILALDAHEFRKRSATRGVDVVQRPIS